MINDNNVPWVEANSPIPSLRFWIPKKSIILVWERPTKQKPTLWHKTKINKKETKNTFFFLKKKKEEISTSSSSLARTARAEPRPNRNANDDRPETGHVEATVAFVAEKQLIVVVAGAALQATDVAVIGAFDHEVLGRRHYLRHRFVLPGRQRRTPWRLGAADGAFEGEELLSRCRGGGSRSHFGCRRQGDYYEKWYWGWISN